ncbi:DUF2946 family protein [Salinarimonas sp. NSM]|uniref:DUF2946 family protein n=1 Tax=Salinarimonas sp. NSM TaxID=3458003 RepID=UPI004036C812
MAPPSARRIAGWLHRSLVAIVTLALLLSGFAHVPASHGGGHAAHAADSAYAGVLPEALATLCHGVVDADLTLAEDGTSDGAGDERPAWVPCPFCLLAKSAALSAPLPSLVLRARRVARARPQPTRLPARLFERRAHRSRAPPRISIA